MTEAVLPENSSAFLRNYLKKRSALKTTATLKTILKPNCFSFRLFLEKNMPCCTLAAVQREARRARLPVCQDLWSRTESNVTNQHAEIQASRSLANYYFFYFCFLLTPRSPKRPLWHFSLPAMKNDLERCMFSSEVAPSGAAQPQSTCALWNV